MAVKTFAARDAVHEKTDAEYECVFTDAADGAPQLDEIAITAITATLVDVAAGQTVNARDDQDVRNANGGALAADGKFTLRLSAADNVIIGTPSGTTQQRRLTLKVAYTKSGGGAGALNHEVLYYVRNLADVA